MQGDDVNFIKTTETIFALLSKLVCYKQNKIEKFFISFLMLPEGEIMTVWYKPIFWMRLKIHLVN